MVTLRLKENTCYKYCYVVDLSYQSWDCSSIISAFFGGGAGRDKAPNNDAGDAGWSVSAKQFQLYHELIPSRSHLKGLSSNDV